LIRSKRGLIILGVLVFLTGLIVSFPARVAIGLLPPSGIAVSGIEGTIWRGKATEAAITSIYLRDIAWQARPLQLLTGRLAFQIEAVPVSGFLDTQLSVGLDKKIRLANLTAAVPLEMFSDAIGVQGLQGNVSLNFERVELLDGLTVVADGVAQVANLIVPVIGRNSLGAYKAEFRSQNNGVIASIEDSDAVVELAGSLQIRTDRSFQLLAQVIVKPETPESVRQQLRFLPPPNERGQQELRLEGIL
jgi:general secretion pathway protein N